MFELECTDCGIVGEGNCDGLVVDNDDGVFLRWSSVIRVLSICLGRHGDMEGIVIMGVVGRGTDDIFPTFGTG